MLRLEVWKVFWLVFLKALPPPPFFQNLSADLKTGENPNF